MKPDCKRLQALYAQSFPDTRPWSKSEIAGLLGDPACVFVASDHGLAIARCAADEAEIITIAVAQTARHRGKGRKMLVRLENLAQTKGAETMFLEVAEDNKAAVALYAGAGYSESGRRRSYYHRKNSQNADALIMSKPLKAH